MCSNGGGGGGGGEVGMSHESLTKAISQNLKQKSHGLFANKPLCLTHVL